MHLYFKALLHDIFRVFFSKDGLILKALIAIATFFSPVYYYALSILALLIFDLITGLWASLKRGEPFKSRILRKGLLEKTALYSVMLASALIFGKLLQSVLHFETFYTAWILTIMISVYEFSSIVENVIDINPKLKFLAKYKDLIANIGKRQVSNVEETFGCDSCIKNEETFKDQTSK